MIFSLLVLSALTLGTLSSGSNVFTKYTISAPGINASFIPYGATLTNLFVPDKDGNPQDVVLGYDTGAAYLHDTETNHTYFGAVVGRYANRIKNGTFTVQYVCSKFISPNLNPLMSLGICPGKLESRMSFKARHILSNNKADGETVV